MNVHAVQHDADGVIHLTLRANVRDPRGWLRRAAAAAVGLVTLAVPLDHDVMTAPYRWKVQDGALVKKTQVALAVSGIEVTASAAPTVTSPAAITTSIRLPSRLVPIADGTGTLPAPLPAGTRIHVVHDDPTFYSEPTVVA